MTDRVENVLFLCTGNSARSLLAEATLNHPAVGRGRFRAYSAGSQPAGRPNPFALELLVQKGIDTDGLRSKSWNEFAAAGAPALDYVFTVCDYAAAEHCPIWPGHPLTAHWGVPDPAAEGGSDDDKRVAFAAAFAALGQRIERFVQLPAAQRRQVEVLREIGRG
jgi:arsenate reductase